MGPYPFDLSMTFLDEWLDTNDGEIPPLALQGSWIGIDASMLERLSGALMCINTQDQRTRLSVSKEKQDALDKLCAKYGLRWRKLRDAAGVVIEGQPPTFLQAASAKLKDMWKENCATKKHKEFFETYYKYYPSSIKQERPDVTAAKLAPPRMRNIKRAAIMGTPTNHSSAAAGQAAASSSTLAGICDSMSQMHISSVPAAPSKIPVMPKKIVTPRV
jgi:hypothetical protein